MAWVKAESSLTKRRRTVAAAVRARNRKRWALASALLLLLALMSPVVLNPLGLVVGGLVTLSASRKRDLSDSMLAAGAQLEENRWPRINDAIRELSKRAGVRAPELYWLDDPNPTTIIEGTAAGPSALAVSIGAVVGLSSRELAGVLAHDIARLKADRGVFRVLDSAAMKIMEKYVFLLLAASVLMGFLSGTSVRLLLPALAVALTLPLLVTLLNAALSRSGELAADLAAVELTGDPQGLASALARMQSEEQGWLRRLLGAPPLVGAFRSRASARKRVRVLIDLEPPPFPPPEVIPGPSSHPDHGS